MITGHTTSSDSDDDSRAAEERAGLSAKTEEQILDQIVALAEAGQPLQEGLRRVVPLLSSRNDANAVRKICRQLDAGAPLDQAFPSRGRRGVEVQSVIRVGLESGRLGPVLEQYLLTTRNNRRVWRTFWTMLLYPFGITAVCLLLFLAIGAVLAPMLRVIFTDFAIELPTITLVVLFLVDSRWGGFWLLAGGLVVIGMLLLGHRRLPGRRLRERVADAIPFVGRARRDAATAEVCGLMAVFLEGNVPLDRALGFASEAAVTTSIRDSLRQVADRMREGASPKEAVNRVPGLPASLVPLLRLEGPAELRIDGFRSAGEMHMALSESRVRQVATVLQPIAILTIGVVAGLFVIAVFAPLMRLLGMLT